MRILLAEDDALLARGMATGLEQFGHEVVVSARGDDASERLSMENFDLLVLDIGLPGIGGFEVLRGLRAFNRTLPVILLTARDAVEDRIRGLDLGADDYLIKPVALGELAARIRAQARRLQLEGASRLVHGPLILDCEARRGWLAGDPFELTVREWRVLEYLMRRTERVVPKHQLLEAVARSEDEVGYNAVEVYVSRLRAKLEPVGIRIRTVRGFGYMLEEFRA